MEPIGAWDALIKQGPLVAFMCLIIWYGIKRFDAMTERMHKLEDERSAQNNTNVMHMATVIERNTSVMDRVEKRLESH